MYDFTNSHLKHEDIPRKLQIDGIQWIGGALSALGWFYGELSKALCLEEIEQQTSIFVADPDGELGIPKYLLKPWSDHEENEDGFTRVQRPGTDIHYKGKDQVKKVLEECAASMRGT
jgi:hypothetical protein